MKALKEVSKKVSFYATVALYNGIKAYIDRQSGPKPTVSEVFRTAIKEFLTRHNVKV